MSRFIRPLLSAPPAQIEGKIMIATIVILAIIFICPASFAAAYQVPPVESYSIVLISTVRFWLVVGPQLCDLLLVLVSLFLMLDGVCRWGNNRPGAFQRSLIGLFILHTTSFSLPFLPYLALFLEIWLCARGLEARAQSKALAEKRLLASGKETAMTI